MTESQLLSQYGTLIAEYKELVAKQELSESEYDELVQDLMNLDNIEKQLNEEDNKITAQKVVDAVKALASLV